MSLKIDNLSLAAGAFELNNFNLEVTTGEYFVLMGPTGSGKSMLLKSICGLHPITSGSILIDGIEVTNLEPKARNLGYVPQNSNLFPHLNVKRNISFPLDVRGVPAEKVAKKVANLAELLKIKDLLLRTTQNLSGGERQKVALARALATEPALLLLDEPVSALDEQTRKKICKELVIVQKELNITTIHISHSLEEAKSVADRIGDFVAF